jgi:oxygen-dependent protoporphyrinogen oxidase
MPQANHQPRVAIVGGGITGLAAAHRLLELNPRLQVSLFEAGPRLGGVLETTNREGCLVEEGPDGFRADPPFGVELARRVGWRVNCCPPIRRSSRCSWYARASSCRFRRALRR